MSSYSKHKLLQNQLFYAAQVRYLNDAKASSPKPLILSQLCPHHEILSIILGLIVTYFFTILYLSFKPFFNVLYYCFADFLIVIV